MEELIASVFLPGLETRWAEELKLSGVKNPMPLVEMLFEVNPSLPTISKEMSKMTGKDVKECRETLKRIAQRISQKELNSSAEIIKTTDLEDVGDIIQPVTTPMGQVEETIANASFTDESFEAAVIEPALDDKDPYVEERSSVIGDCK